MLVRSFEIHVGRVAQFVGVRSVPDPRRRGRSGTWSRSRTTRRSCRGSSCTIAAIGLRRAAVVRRRAPRSTSTCLPRLDPRPASTFFASDVLEQRAAYRDATAPVSRCTKNAIGVPHCRWRDSVQSGRLAIIECRRDLPHVRKEARRVDGGERRLAQGGTALGRYGAIHAGEPLRRRAIDDRRLVPPAMHVAVRELACARNSAPASRSVSTTFGIRVPDRQPGEQRFARRVGAVAGDRVDDVVVRPARSPCTRQEVLDAVRGRRVDDAGPRARASRSRRDRSASGADRTGARTPRGRARRPCRSRGSSRRRGRRSARRGRDAIGSPRSAGRATVSTSA